MNQINDWCSSCFNLGILGDPHHGQVFTCKNCTSYYNIFRNPNIRNTISREIKMKEQKSLIKTFLLERMEDVSGVSGTGVIAEGVEFTDGSCVMKWLSHTSSFEIFPNIKALDLVHGHDGKTKIVYNNGTNNIHNNESSNSNK